MIQLTGLYIFILIYSSINELVDCSENAARKICGADAAKFTRELVDKYANSLTKVSVAFLSIYTLTHTDYTTSSSNE